MNFENKRAVAFWAFNRATSKICCFYFSVVSVSWKTLRQHKRVDSVLPAPAKSQKTVLVFLAIALVLTRPIIYIKIKISTRNNASIAALASAKEASLLS